MKIIGVDLHTRQQSIAMLDDQTGELVEKELQHEGEQVREFYSGSAQAGAGGSGSHGLDARGFCGYSKSWPSSFASVIPRRSGRPNRASKKTTAAMRVCCSRCWRKIAFPRFGCLLVSNAICRFFCGIAISLCASAPAYSSACKRWHSVTGCAVATPCGPEEANTPCGLCRWLLMPASSATP